MFLLNPEMIDQYYFTILESTLKKWLSSSISVSAFAKSRSEFTNGMILKILDDFPFIENGIINHRSNTVTFTNAAIEYNLIVKTVATPFEYPQCIRLSNNEYENCRVNLIKSIEDVVSTYEKNTNNSFSRTFLVYAVFPCTHNDKEWEPFLKRIKPFVKTSSQLHDFRFINNLPGSIYIGEINRKSPDLDALMADTPFRLQPMLNNIEKNEKEKNKIERFKINRQNILEDIQKEMIKNDSTYSFDELQELFEERYKFELKTNYPKIKDEEMKRIINKFQSNGSGAKRAHILLTTVNEKHRAHYRPNIKNNYSLYNLFYYVDENNRLNKKFVKAFDINNPEISDDIKVYFETSKKDSEERPFEFLGEIRANYRKN